MEQIQPCSVAVSFRGSFKAQQGTATVTGPSPSPVVEPAGGVRVPGSDSQFLEEVE